MSETPEAPEAPEEGWVRMTHPDSGGTADFPDDPTVIAAQQARGWVPVEDDKDHPADGPGEDDEPADTADDTEE